MNTFALLAAPVPLTSPNLSSEPFGPFFFKGPCWDPLVRDRFLIFLDPMLKGFNRKMVAQRAP